MEHTRLGETELVVSRVALGTWQFGGDWGAVDEQTAKRTVERALELGINTFDTARAYGWDRAERIVGEALSEVLEERRDEIVIVSKGGLRPGEDRNVRATSPEHLREDLEQSRSALGVDVIDLYLVHWPDLSTPFEDVAETLASFKEEGLVRAIGVSNFSADQAAAVDRVAPLDAVEPPYHLLRREAEAALLPYCERNDIGVISYGTLAHGLLTGKYGPESTFPAEDWRSGNPWFEGTPLERNTAVVEELSEVAEDLGTDVKHLAIAWVLYHPAVDSAIVGARRPEHVEDIAPAGELELSRRAFDQIHRCLDEVVGIGGTTPETA